MPNHCINHITFKGKDAFKKVQEHIDSKGHFSLQKCRPEPKELLEEGSALSRERYSWRLQNWGSKWEPYECHATERSKDECYLECMSAWAPTEKGFAAFCEEHGLAMEAEWAEEDQNAGSYKYSPESGLESIEYKGEDALRKYKKVFGV